MCLTDVDVPHSYIRCLIRMNWYLSHKLPNYFVLLIILKVRSFWYLFDGKSHSQDIIRVAIMANFSEYYLTTYYLSRWSYLKHGCGFFSDQTILTSISIRGYARCAFCEDVHTCVQTLLARSSF